MKSKKDVFKAGHGGLQACRARAIQSYLWMVVKSKKTNFEVGQIAAMSQGISEKWGGRLVRSWAQKWIQQCEPPVSLKGCHRKTFSLYDDPAIRAELQSYVQSNKWAMDPQKLAQFSQQILVPLAAAEYLKQITSVEMPEGLKKYMELELFPRIHLKAKKGVSLKTATCFLRREGFAYTEHKKGLYYDGHERPDVIEDQQAHFLPEMAKHEEHLVRYVVGKVEDEVLKAPSNYVERQLVLCAHDEMTAQANDGKKKSWVLNGEQPLRKKGQG